MADNGCRTIICKVLAANDNRKQQIYLGGNFTAINLLPFREIRPDPDKSHILKAGLDFWWLSEDGSSHPAPKAQLILYSQYPEVRFSGFLARCPNAPSEMMDESLRLSGRILFMGIRQDGKIVGYLCHPESELAKEFRTLKGLSQQGVFIELGLDEESGQEEIVLLTELRRIYMMGWIRSKRLGSKGQLLPCEAPQCGGYTLEAELGIIPNGVSEPDFHGYEVKQHNVTSFDRIDVGVLTLMTPQPTGGYYKEKGVEAFVRRFGYPDMTGRAGREDRLNFGGIHRAGVRHSRTGLTLSLIGFDPVEGKIHDATGGIALLSSTGEEAAIWHYADIMKHWNRKHAKAAYVPSIKRKTPDLCYQYGSVVRIGEGTDFLLYLKAMNEGQVYYDPGIKLENASTKPKAKHRSQFRMKSAHLPSLYHRMRKIDLSAWSTSTSTT
ncbi:hypothetical protein B5V00_06165 [Geothermobacter hydrogeniphilus]|uniref:MvaI/BcnI restriction endonuclease domain-containing protein n=2 Tax=Geothermobacter hydrogeniphilus TaxID=1969733 RepID=A0A1X0Y933_9BACT|nr:hypothetical protein B5V00_06165 [Geothermobacter hydrogeniphilus]